jgi:hypothetical protein
VGNKFGGAGVGEEDGAAAVMVGRAARVWEGSRRGLKRG